MKTSRGTTAKAATVRDVLCPECGGGLRVASKAMSVFCPQCSSRVILEDFRITGYHASRNFATAGNIVVESKGSVSAPIKVHHLVVKGQVRGSVLAWGSVEVTTTGQLRGDVTAPTFVVRTGGRFEGHCRIGVGPERKPPGLRGRLKAAGATPRPAKAATRPKPKAKARSAKTAT